MAAAVTPPKKSLHAELTESHLECAICSEVFKHPKLMPCLHTFCKHCIEGLVASTGSPFPCPICRTETTVPGEGINGLKNNFFMINLIDTVTKHDTREYSCEVCDENGLPNVVAEYHCIDCRDNLCVDCKGAHRRTKQTRSHRVVTFNELNEMNGAMKDEIRAKQQIYCEAHRDEPVIIYCENCQTLICMRCVVDKHKGHNCEALAEAARQAKDEIQEYISSIAAIHATYITCGTSLQTLKQKFNRKASIVEGQITEWQQQRKAIIQYAKTKDGLELKSEYLKKLKDVEDWYREGQEIQREKYENQERESTEKGKHFNERLRITRVSENKTFDVTQDQVAIKLGTLRSTLDMAHKITKLGQAAEILFHQNQIVERIKQLKKEQIQPSKITTHFLQFQSCVESVEKTELASNEVQVLLTPTLRAEAVLIRTFGSKTPSDETDYYSTDLTVLSNGDVCTIDCTGQKVKLFTPQGNLKWEVTVDSKPYSVAVMNDDNIMVTKLSQSEVDVFDCQGKKLKSIEHGQKAVCTGLAVRDDVIVTTEHTGNKGVYVCDQSLNVTTTIQNELSNSPVFVAISDTKIVTSDNQAHCVFLNTHAGDHVTTYGTPGTAGDGPGKLKLPWGVCTDMYNNIMVADCNRTVHLLDREGQFVQYVLTPDNLESSPAGVAIAPEGHLVVLLNNGRVKTYQYIE